MKCCARAFPLLLSLILLACSSGTPPYERPIDPPAPDAPLQLDFPRLALDDFYLYMDAADLSELYSRSIRSDDRLPGQFRLSLNASRRSLRPESIRFRGNTARQLPKKSFNIRFDNIERFAFHTNRFNLNAMYTDPAMMREHLAFSLFHDRGQPAPATRYFNVHINDIFEGLYIGIQRIDAAMLAQNNLPVGEHTLVRDQLRGSGLGAMSIFSYDISRESDLEAFLEDNFDYRDDPDWSALAELVTWAHRTEAGSAFEQGFRERIDLDNFLDWFAIHILIADIDSYADDYWLYLDHSDPDAKWLFIPWDKDLSFGSHTVFPPVNPDFITTNHFFHIDFAPDAGFDNDLVRKFFATDSLSRLLAERVETLMQEDFRPEVLAARIDDIAALIADSVNITPSSSSFVQHPQNHFGELGDFALHTESIKDFVALRYQFLDRLINPIRGDPYQASVDVAELDPSAIIHFTDAQGWTIASLLLDDPADAPSLGSISIRVEQDDSSATINRRWQLDWTGEAETLSGELRVYYRNRGGSARRNWYRVNDAQITPTGSQASLAIWLYDEDGAHSPLSSSANPYSNKVSANVSLQNGQQWLLETR